MTGDLNIDANLDVLKNTTLNGSITYSSIYVDSNYSITYNDNYIRANATNGDVWLDLPNSSLSLGVQFRIKALFANDTNRVIVNGTKGELIEGDFNAAIVASGSAFNFNSFGSGWDIT